MVTAAILAGGQARRLGGRDKSRLMIGAETILDRQLRVLAGVTDRIMIVASDTARFAGLGVPVVADLVPGAGSLGGIHTALAAAAGDRVLVVGCDMPFLTAPFLCFVADAALDADAAMPRTADGWQPLCACYARACAAPLARRLHAGQLRIVDLLDDVRVREIGPAEIAPFDPDGRLLVNVNTPEDLAAAQARA